MGSKSAPLRVVAVRFSAFVFDEALQERHDFGFVASAVNVPEIPMTALFEPNEPGEVGPRGDERLGDGNGGDLVAGPVEGEDRNVELVSTGDLVQFVPFHPETQPRQLLAEISDERSYRTRVVVESAREVEGGRIEHNTEHVPNAVGLMEERRYHL